jgi:4-hydroxybenzoate polyprenyltransferase
LAALQKEMAMHSTTNNVLWRHLSQLPEAGYAKRLANYLAQMYPVPPRLFLAALTYFGVTTFLGKINGVSSAPRPVTAFVGIASIFSVMLIIRLMDEIKDKEIDRQFFPERPLPSGKIFEADIRATIVAVTLFYLLINLVTGANFSVALFLLAYTFLMFKHFFIPTILQKSLLLTLATHNPLVALMLLYVAALFVDQAAIELAKIDWRATVLLIVMNWATVLAWEISRKIRRPADENGYVTYSQIFGPNGALLFASTAQCVTLVIGMYFVWSLALAPLFAVLWAIAYLVPMAAYARFLLRPTATTAKVGPYAEAYMVIVLALQTCQPILSA